MAEQTYEEPLFGCFQDWTSCLIVSLVPLGSPCIHGIAVSRAQQKGLVIPFLLSAFLGPIGAAFNRAQVREVYGIEGNFCFDMCIHIWCHCCAVCQEYRQSLKKQGKFL